LPPPLIALPFIAVEHESLSRLALSGFVVFFFLPATGFAAIFIDLVAPDPKAQRKAHTHAKLNFYREKIARENEPFRFVY
jgi:hypothetical protein